MNNPTTELPRGFEEFEKDGRWFYDNLDALRKKGLVGTFVVVKNQSVIAYDKNIKEVVKIVEKQGENPACLVIEYVYPEGTVILL